MYFSSILLCFSWALLVSVFAIPSIISVAHSKKLLDTPNARTIHEMLTPRLGGLAIFAGFLSAITIFGKVQDAVQQMLAGCIIIFFIGLKDDIVTVSAFKKFFVQILATSIVLFLGGVRITSFHGFIGIGTLDLGLSYLFTAIVVVGITNSINLIDGLDGLAGSIIFIISVTLGICFYIYGADKYAIYCLSAFCLAGSILGFLRYNIYKAIIFMGDAGSLTSGFILSTLAIQFVEMDAFPSSSSPAVAMAILYIPILDTLRIFVIRIFQGKSPFSPDKNHIHHVLILAGLSQPLVITVLVILNVLAILVAIYFAYLGTTWLIIIFFGITLFLLLIVFLIKKHKVIEA